MSAYVIYEKFLWEFSRVHTLYSKRQGNFATSMHTKFVIELLMMMKEPNFALGPQCNQGYFYQVSQRAEHYANFHDLVIFGNNLLA